MIARVSTWTPRGRAVAEDKIIKEVLFDYHDVSQNEAEIVVRFAVPDWFKGLYLVKRQGHVFVRIKEAAKHLPHTTAPL